MPNVQQPEIRRSGETRLVQDSDGPPPAGTPAPVANTALCRRNGSRRTVRSRARKVNQWSRRGARRGRLTAGDLQVPARTTATARWSRRALALFAPLGTRVRDRLHGAPDRKVGRGAAPG